MACKEHASLVKDVEDIEEETGWTPTDVRFLTVDPVDAIPYNAKYAVGHDFEAELEEGESVVIHKFVTVHTSRDKARHPQEGTRDLSEPVAKARVNASERCTSGMQSVRGACGKMAEAVGRLGYPHRGTGPGPNGCKVCLVPFGIPRA